MIIGRKYENWLKNNAYISKTRRDIQENGKIFKNESIIR